MRPFRFGLTLTAAASAAEWKAEARKAEDQGFDVLTTPDHIGALYPPLLPLLAAAEATTRLHVGTLVLNNDFRHPALLAREAATLAQLSGGRFELGMGAGHAQPEYESIGLPFEPARVRVARLAESVRILRAMFAGAPVTFSGQHYQVREQQLFPPLEAPIPLLIGGHSRSLLRLAAREADIIGFTGLGRTLADGQRHVPSGFTAASVDERVALVRAAAGERFERIQLHCLVQRVIVTNDRRGAAEEMAAAIPPLDVEDVLASPFLLVGTAAEIADDLRERRARWGFSYVSTFGRSMNAMARVIAAIHSR